ncbi:ATP-binding protein [Leeia aquatica]|uniref:ATP-binding protein n=1 Tax=Leeia aquatica TaxID=2725557 RepID=A0A847S6B1_9NEIS|nr:ATP-binding protein [Leeia aquatica]NLR75303.1 ATP-binding protein [Leeia aquatica]
MSELAKGALGTSILASGPAGTHFEAQVGASYLLAMLAGAPARGLPGATIDRVALQQANTGHPLDDVVIHAHDNVSGELAVLEVQVKRSITFSAADPIFRKVVGQIVKASQRPDFLTQRYELAIATTKGSRKIDGAYQDVLTLARQIGDAATFATQIDLAGVANDDMRAFIKTFKSHLQDENSLDDNETVWLLLRRLQILTFDFTASGSASHDLALERAVRVLHPDDGSRAGAFWGSLIELAIDVAKSGGDRTRETALQALAQLGYRFLGERRHATARAALAESSRLALADIRNRVGNVVLARQERVTATREALDRGRYVEIRGDAGVGKSGVLRQMAEAMQAESQVIVLSPGRCVPRGWTALRAQLSFDGTLRELLVELANDGGATIFVDNLDSFSAEERATVVDVVGEASVVPGVVVVATARREFGIDEPSWLPSDALARLGGTDPIMIGELSKVEIEQLKVTNPSLAPLLTDGHPARQVTRNLFRLARLASQPASDPVPRTEVDMAEQWWTSADGARDTGWRDRTRLLQGAAAQTLSGADFLDVTGQAAAPIDALVSSGTLRDLGIDRVAFRHDVLREWAIASALHADPELVDRLQLDRPAAAMFARGVELAGRMAIERATDGARWHALFDRLSQAGVHRSWRRAALLALARSEAAEALLQRASPELLANGAALLRELIRTVMAVDVLPAAKVFGAAGVDPALIPSSINVPRGPAWTTLIIWLLGTRDEVPNEAIPEIVQLFAAFSVGTLGATDITPLTTQQIYRWLRLMEPRDAMPTPSEGPVFWAHLDRDGVQSLKSDLRDAFVMFARTTPELAAEYLTAVGKSEHNEDIVRSILKMRGTLAQAAPAELANLIAQVLIARPRQHEHYSKIEREDVFTYYDYNFRPTSLAQNLFLDLLTHSPKDGLILVHRLVAHALLTVSQRADPRLNSIDLVFPEGARTFTWTQSYEWSRYSNFYAVTSALMALEAWAHHRIEAGEAFEAVLADVLGPQGSCAAYLLLAVDLIISHWPKSLDVAATFLSCPELLCMDHSRKVQDRLGIPDLFGVGALRNEPVGSVTAADLRRRPSRGTALDELLGNFTFLATPDQLTTLRTLLATAAARLGEPATSAHLGNPEFMVRYALNLSDTANWQEVEVTLKDGSSATARKYVSPEAEQTHLQALRDAATERESDFATRSVLTLAVDDPARLLPEGRSAAVAWARRSARATTDIESDDDDGERRMQEEAIVTAAMIVMRDGDDALRAEHGEWARSQLDTTLAALDDNPDRQMRGGLRFNPTAIAYAGLIHSLRHRSTPEDVRLLLEVAATGNHAAAHGFGTSAAALAEVDSRLPRAVLRCAFSASVVENRAWDASPEDVDARKARSYERARTAVDAEMAWLGGESPEPTWPAFPVEKARPRRRLHLPGIHIATPEAPVPSPAKHVNHQAAALWLRQVFALPHDDTRPWLNEIVKAYMPWTALANGANLNDGDETDRPPSEWNDPFFAAVARCVVGLSTPEAAELAVRHIVALPDRNFYDVLVDFLRSIDAVYFEGDNISTQVAIDTRRELADHMITTRGWERLSRSRDLSIGMHIGPAIAVLFFNDHMYGQESKCYLFEKGVKRVGPFLPVLGKLVSKGPSLFVALVLLNLLEVAPRVEQLDVLVGAGSVWIEAYPDFRQLWIDHGVGRRWCLLIEAIRAHSPDSFSKTAPFRPAIDTLVASLIALGVPEARWLEEELSKL